MKETAFEEWLKWANSTNELGIANVEPVISNILVFSDDIKNLFMGNSWNGSNWVNISNSYRNMLTFLLLKNPLKYQYPTILGRSIKELKYPGVSEIYLCEALSSIPKERWIEFCSDYLPEKKENISIYTNGNNIEKLQLIRDALTRIIKLYTGSSEVAEQFEQYYEFNYPINKTSDYRSELEELT